MPHLGNKTGDFRTVYYTSDEVAAFNRTWPCSTLRSNRAYWFQFARNGDLVDTDVPEQDDGPASVALSHEAQKWLADEEPEFFK